MKKLLGKLTKNKISLSEFEPYANEAIRTILEKRKVPDADVEEAYKLYPAKCFTSKRLTGKTPKNKVKIRELIQKKGKDTVIRTIKAYAENCKDTNSYVKNLTTFLNNFPEFELEEKEPSVMTFDEVIEWRMRRNE